MTIRSEMQPRHGTACRFVHYYPLTSPPTPTLLYG